MNKYDDIPPPSLILEGVNKTAFIFLHGLSTSVLDLKHIAETINKEGYYCELIQLEGHGENYSHDNKKIYYKIWLEQIKISALDLKIKYENIYIIGFSIGASLALLSASDKTLGIKGVICISAFFEPAKKIQYKIAQIIAKFKKRGVSRGKPNTTFKASRENIWWFKKIPNVFLENALIIGKQASGSLHKIDCPILFLHSINDQVSSYKKVENSIFLSSQKHFKLITFVELKHFLQFDIHPQEFFQTIKIFFNIDHYLNKIEHCPSRDELLAQYKNVTEESRQWSSYCFRIVVGFFSIMTGLLYFSYSDIFEGNAKAPYYLLGYSIFINVYIQLFSLYYFYTMRSDIYLKYFIEPLLCGISWIEYKTNRWLSRKTSEKFTDIIMLSTIAMPIFSSFLILVYFYYYYYSVSAGITLQILSFMSIVTFILGIRIIYLTHQYTSQNLYGNLEKYEPIELLHAVFHLKQSVFPGRKYVQ